MTSIFRYASTEIHGAGEATIYFHSNQAYLRVGDWKLMNVITRLMNLTLVCKT